jgi:hypothetical protein
MCWMLLIATALIPRSMSVSLHKSNMACCIHRAHTSPFYLRLTRFSASWCLWRISTLVPFQVLDTLLGGGQRPTILPVPALKLAFSAETLHPARLALVELHPQRIPANESLSLLSRQASLLTLRKEDDHAPELLNQCFSFFVQCPLECQYACMLEVKD